MMPLVLSQRYRFEPRICVSKFSAQRKPSSKDVRYSLRTVQNPVSSILSTHPHESAQRKPSSKDVRYSLRTVQNPVSSTIKKASFVYRTKDAFLNDVFRCAERDVSCGRDVCFASDVRFARAKRNTSHHFAAKPQNITMPHGKTSLAPDGANIIHLFCLPGQERFLVLSIYGIEA